MILPLISITIATLNSEKTLVKTLESIKKQDYPQKKIEILIVDAGSTDKTIKIARKYKCRILYSSKIELTFAKQIGFLKAKGKYLIFLDSDEVLENKKSLYIKYNAFKENSNVKMVMLSGYKTPSDYSPINYYINEFGDPFSFFMYREGKGNDFLIRDLRRNYKNLIISENDNDIIFDFSKQKYLPLIELWAGGCMIDLNYMRAIAKQIKKSPDLVPHLFYILNNMKKLLAVTKNDNTIHYSSASFRKYLKKISSRIKYNISLSSMGKGGYTGRENYSPLMFRFKKYLFIPYSLTFIFPIFDSIYLTLTRKKLIYMTHWVLCFYTALVISYYYLAKIVGVKPTIEEYGK